MKTKSSDDSQTGKNAKMSLAPTVNLEDKWFPHKIDFLLLTSLTVFMILHNAVWLSRDNLNPSIDEAFYLVKSLETFEMITDPGLDTLKTLYFQSEGPRPTFFFTALSVPFYLLFGVSGDVAILGVNSFFYFVIIFGTYVIGAHFFGRRVGLLAAMVTCLNQEIATLSRVFWPHFSVIAIVVAGSCLLFKSRLLTNKRCTLSFGFLLGFGLMMRPVYPAIFLIGPMIVVAVLALFDNSREEGTISILRDVKRKVVYANFKSRIIGGLFPACAIAGVVAGPFYFQFMSRTLAFVHANDANPVRRVDTGVFWYLNNIQKDVSLGVVVFIVIGLAWSVVVSRSRSGTLLLCTSIMFVIISAVPVAKAFFFFAPIYPFLLILAVHWIFEIGSPWLRWILSVFLVSCSGLVFIQSAWQWPNVFSDNIPVKYFFEVQPLWLARIDNLDYHLDEAAELIRSDAHHDADSEDALVVSFVSCNRFLNSPTFNYLSWPTGKDFTYIEVWFPLSALLLADYVLVDLRCPITQLPVIAASPKMLLNPDSAFYEKHRCIANFPITRGQREIRLLEVYKRTSPSSQSDIEAITAELRDVVPNAALLIGREIPEFAEFDPSLVPAMESALATSVELEPQR